MEQNYTSRAKCVSPQDEIVISGISGRFPNSHNMQEFSENLYNKVDMVDDAETRWRHTNSEIPTRMGKVHDLEKFDAQFFGVHFKQGHTMDPQTRMLIEHSYEAIIDAGINPKSMRGSRTGVFVGACFSESEHTWFYEKITSNGIGIVGCARAMFANRISYTLGLTGPSFLLDTACSSSMYALDLAYNAIQNGECDSALVGGSNLLLHPYVTLQFARLGVLASDGYCRPFDQNATGYTRSEAICVLFLQKSRDAKRVYANLMYSKTNCDGYKEEGITYPSGIMQSRLLTEFYQEIGVNPSEVDYVEAHSTGTVVGDPEECSSLDKIFCGMRDKPLLVGSVKSNIGHTEPCSGACSIAKSILIFENRLIPPNINFKKPRDGIPSLTEGRLQVVTEPTPTNGTLVAINSFGFGGANAHALLKANLKEKVNAGIPDDNLPRVVMWSGRTELAVNTILDAISSRHLDAEYVGLLHNIQSDTITGNVFRGYGVFAKNGDQNAICLGREVQHYNGVNLPLVWVFSGMGSQWIEMGTSLMELPIFRAAIQNCHNILRTRGLDLIKIITSKDKNTFDNILHSFVGIAAIQIGIVDILKELGIEPDYIIGHSVGELGCAYADGCFTAKQMILAAYSRGMASLETKVVKGSMAAIGLGFKKIRTILPSSIEVACHNGPDSCTISGPSDCVASFVAELKSKGIFAKEVPSSNIPYHSKYIAEMGPRLLSRLFEVIPEPKKRSSKWLSSSVPKVRWEQQETQYSSAEYHTNNLLSPVLFEEASALLPQNSLTIEIAPHGLLQAILKKSLPNGTHIGLTQRGNKDNIQFMLNALGKLYINGLDLPVSKLYPKIGFPVGRGTPMISPLMKWDHSEDWFVSKFDTVKSPKSGERKVKISLSDQEFEYVSGHVIDGRILFPATAYLYLAWETLALTQGPMFFNIDVEFEDVKFLRATEITKNQEIEFTVMVHAGSGKFEISEGKTSVVIGYVRNVQNLELAEMPSVEESDKPMLQTRDFYKELRLRGYHYNGAFKSVLEARSDGYIGKIKWDLNWVSFMDCLLQANIIGRDSRSLMIPTAIQKLKINPTLHLITAKKMGELENQVFEFKSSKYLNMIRCGGIEIRGLQATTIGRRKPPGYPVLETYKFIPHLPAPEMSKIDTVRVCVQLALENLPLSKVKSIELCTDEHEPLITLFQNALGDLPLVTSDLMLLTQKELEFPGIQVVDGKLSSQTNSTFVIASNCLSNPDFLEQALSSLTSCGFLLSREQINLQINDIKKPNGYQIIAILPVEDETLILLQSSKRKIKGPAKVVTLSPNDVQYIWLDELKEATKSGNVLVVAENDTLSGIIGLVNCIRKEPEGFSLTCVFVDDETAPPFTLEHQLYKEHLKLGLSVNVYRDGKWGSYRHLQLRNSFEAQAHYDHCYVNELTRGDLTSLTWLSGPYNTAIPKGDIIKVSYSSLNFRDVMLASGKLSTDVAGMDRLNECCFGLEYSGFSEHGQRVMGVIKSNAMSSHVSIDRNLAWLVPVNWSLEEAATVPIAYLTVYSSFFLTGRISKGKSILIHAGSGGVGLAAIRVALAYGMEVYTTVSTKLKRDFLLNAFPGLEAENIGNSRDTSFEKMIMYRTKGRGVDFVLNSLAEEKLQASIRCLGQGGKFLEIGKFDMTKNSKIGMNVFLNEISFHAILVDTLFKGTSKEKVLLHDLIMQDIESGVIVPLKTTVFPASQVEQAFRYLGSGKHVGKVLLQIRKNDQDDMTLPICVLPRIYCNPNQSYIIPGGLGGFGLELADWLIIRGCRKIVLSTSRGITKQYQAYRINVWESYGVKVVVSTHKITTMKGCEDLIIEALKLGPVGGIFNLAVALHDSILDNQSPDKFQECMAPKATATKYLDELSRKMCPQMKYFVIFSSVSCGRGNAGQGNYGMANSVMERIIEQRYAKGLPAKAIQWGAVGEVGLVADLAEDKLDMEIGGTLQQRISSCLQELDALLLSDEPVVASMVVAEKRLRGSGNAGLMETIMNIMSIRDIKSVSMDTTLSELGMDSLMAVEIKQTLEREFELFLTPQDLRSLTFMKLQKYQESREISDESPKLKQVNSETPTGVALLFRNLGDEAGSYETILKLKSSDNSNKYNVCVLLIPGIEGVAGNAWHNIASQLPLPTFILQLMATAELKTIGEIAEAVFEDVKNVFKGTESFYLVGYSFGSTVTLALASLLEAFGMHGKVLLVDGSPDYLKKLACDHISSEQTDKSIQTALMEGITRIFFPDESSDVVRVISELTDAESSVNKLIELSQNHNIYSEQYIKKMYHALFNRIKSVISTDLEIRKPLKASITLIRPSGVSLANIDEDYGLSKYSESPITLKFIEGNHITILENPKLAKLVTEMNPGVEQEKFLIRELL